MWYDNNNNSKKEVIMKKKLLLFIGITALSITLIGCGDKNTIPKGTEKDSSESIDTEEIPGTEALLENDTEAEPPAFDPTGYEEFNQVYYKLLDGYWIFNKDTEGTRVYANSDQSDSIALYVQKETMQTKEAMLGAYEELIVSTYGESYSVEDITAANLPWKVYHFGADNKLASDRNVDVYLFSDGKTTFYLENAFLVTKTSSGKALELINTIVIQ